MTLKKLDFKQFEFEGWVVKINDFKVIAEINRKGIENKNGPKD